MSRTPSRRLSSVPLEAMSPTNPAVFAQAPTGTAPGVNVEKDVVFGRRRRRPEVDIYRPARRRSGWPSSTTTAAASLAVAGRLAAAVGRGRHRVCKIAAQYRRGRNGVDPRRKGDPADAANAPRLGIDPARIVIAGYWPAAISRLRGGHRTWHCGQQRHAWRAHELATWRSMP